MQYELFYLVGERQEANLDAIREGVNAMLVQEGAKFVGEEETEKRKLAYEIKHQNRGVYITRRFELEDIDFWAQDNTDDKEFGIQSITNKLNLNKDVLRSMIVKTSDLPEPGAKERRKAQELNGAKQSTRNEKTVRREAPKREFSKPAPAKEEVKEAKVKKTEVQETGAKNIDKQLDELLNI